MAVMAGIRTAPYGENSVRYGSGDMIVTGISTGSWIGIYGASFGSEGAQEIQFEIRGKQQGKILVYMDIPEGKAVAEIEAVHTPTGKRISFASGAVCIIDDIAWAE